MNLEGHSHSKLNTDGKAAGKPSNPKGTRDFGPVEVRRRNKILKIIRTCFERFGFEPIETPAFENLSSLTGKYGEEGDKLLFRILNSGDVYSGLDPSSIKDNNEFLRRVSKKGLRYDLTVPFARFVVQNSNNIVFPFRRYQIQNVWRADRPGKGRFQEFTQCDADIIGSRSMLNETDLINIYHEVFEGLELKGAVLRVNHRKLLEALVEVAGLSFDVGRFTSTLDKLDKIGEEGVRKELSQAGVSAVQMDTIFRLVRSVAFNVKSLAQLRKDFRGMKTAEGALDELEEILGYLKDMPISLNIQLDLSLARGLDYYTGCIFEATVPDSGMGSISGGGRYDDLTGVFGLKDLSGVGISFGIDRIYEIIAGSNPSFFQDDWSSLIMLAHFDEISRSYQYRLAHELRKNGLRAFVFPDLKKLQKQLDYANKRRLNTVLIAGDAEMEAETVMVKDMRAGSNTAVKLTELIPYLQNKLG